MSIESAKDWATVIGVVVALFTLWKSLIEYTNQGKQKRAEHFLHMRERFKDNVDFKAMCDLLEQNSPELRDVAFKEKRDLLGFFEEIALMMNSGLVSPVVAHYMFGYYAILCWKSEYFWCGLNRHSDYWVLFRDFANQMIDAEKSFKYQRLRFKF